MWDSYAWRTLADQRAADLRQMAARPQRSGRDRKPAGARRRWRVAAGRALVRLGERLAAPAGTPVPR
jgi:hypothetical protein